MKNQDPKIFVYSTDLDFCNSISLLLQSKYQISYSTNVIKFIDYDADLMVFDIPFTDVRILNTLRDIKNTKPEIKILLLYIYRINEVEIENGYRKYSDLLLYKPIDIMQLTLAIENLIFEKTKGSLSKIRKIL